MKRNALLFSLTNIARAITGEHASKKNKYNMTTGCRQVLLKKPFNK